jgi:hypothetical protein
MRWIYGFVAFSFRRFINEGLTGQPQNPPPLLCFSPIWRLMSGDLKLVCIENLTPVFLKRPRKHNRLRLRTIGLFLILKNQLQNLECVGITRWCAVSFIRDNVSANIDITQRLRFSLCKTTEQISKKD